MSPDDFDAKIQRLEAAVADGRTEIASLRGELGTVRGEVNDLKQVVHRLGPLSTQMALNTRQLEILDKDMAEIRDEFRKRTDRLQSSVEAERDERRRVERERTTERKEDRKWLVIAMIMSAGLIISAMAFFYGLQ